MSNKKFSRRKLNTRKVSAQRSQSLKNGAPVIGKVTTLQEANRDVISRLLEKTKS